MRPRLNRSIECRRRRRRRRLDSPIGGLEIALLDSRGASRLFFSSLSRPRSAAVRAIWNDNAGDSASSTLHQINMPITTNYVKVATPSGTSVSYRGNGDFHSRLATRFSECTDSIDEPCQGDRDRIFPSIRDRRMSGAVAKRSLRSASVSLSLRPETGGFIENECECSFSLLRE